MNGTKIVIKKVGAVTFNVAKIGNGEDWYESNFFQGTTVAAGTVFEKRFEKRGIKKVWVLEIFGGDTCRYTCVEEPEHTTGIVHVSNLMIALKSALRRWYPDISKNTINGLSFRVINPCVTREFQDLMKSKESKKRKAPSVAPLPIKITRVDARILNSS